MHPDQITALASEHIADLHRDAAKQRRIRVARAARRRPATRSHGTVTRNARSA